MKIGLLLVGEKGAYVLSELLNKSSDIDIGFVVSYDDKGVDDNSFSKIKELCEKNSISFFEKKEFDNDVSYVNKVIVIGWQFLLKDNLSKYIVIHDSILPKHKGWAPTVNALIEGDMHLGATALAPTDKMDTGAIYCQRIKPIQYPIKIKDAIKIVSDLYVDMVLEIAEKNPNPYEMPKEETFCAWRDSQDYFIDWNDSAERIKRFIDAVGEPYDGAKIKVGDQVLTVKESKVISGEVAEQHKHVGKIMMLKNGYPIVICGENLLHITYVVDSENRPFIFKKLKHRL